MLLNFCDMFVLLLCIVKSLFFLFWLRIFIRLSCCWFIFIRILVSLVFMFFFIVVIIFFIRVFLEMMLCFLIDWINLKMVIVVIFNLIGYKKIVIKEILSIFKNRELFLVLFLIFFIFLYRSVFWMLFLSFFIIILIFLL